MRRLTALLLLSMAALSSAAGAAEVDRGIDSDKFIVRDETPGDEVRREPVGDPVVRWFRYDVLLWDAGLGSFCVDPRWTRDEAYASRRGRIDFVGRFDPNTGVPRVACPDDAVAVPGPQAIAADVWLHVEDLPVPSLQVQPNYAIAGKKTFLEIGGPTGWNRTIDNPIGDDVVIEASSEYLVDWDDPTDTTPQRTSSQGGPYPSGDVTHTYTQSSSRTEITVTQRWTARWRAGSRSGTLAQLETRSSPLVIDVRQLQAVRDR